MASLTMTGVFCSGNAHVRITTTGAVSKVNDVDVAPFLDTLTDEETLGFIKTIGKLAKVGRTQAQVKALFEAGITITV